MSGIYIPRMEMPDRCFSCPMCDTDCCGISKGAYIEYRDIGIDVAIDHRPDWCPLIPVPEHGRLIDADALRKSDRLVGKMMMFGGEYVYTQTEIDRAPTIIPASKEGEE